LSCEALRTITRMMHAMAWLLNQRACFAGEMSEAQLRRHGRLPPPQPEGNGAQLALLDADIRDVIERSRALYARVERIDRAWRAQLPTPPDAVHRLRDQLGRAFG
jgi:regulator of CtrA degradation